MTPQQRAYQRFWEVMTRERGRFPLSWLLAGLFVGHCLAQWLLVSSEPAPKVYITQEDYWRSLAQSYKKRLHEPWQIEAGQHYDYLVERMKERLASARNRKGF